MTEPTFEPAAYDEFAMLGDNAAEVGLVLEATPVVRRESIALASGKHIHIPIGLHLVQWCLLPLQPGEQPASLADWVADQFTGAEA